MAPIPINFIVFIRLKSQSIHVFQNVFNYNIVIVQRILLRRNIFFKNKTFLVFLLKKHRRNKFKLDKLFTL